jgi:hypothetical protein
VRNTQKFLYLFLRFFWRIHGSNNSNAEKNNLSIINKVMNQKSIIAILGVVVVILIGTTAYFATINKSSQLAAPTPKTIKQPAQLNSTTSKIEVYYSFGVGEKNILDIKNDVYVKDMVCDSSKEYDFQLTEPEKTKIYASILENNLLAIKDDFTKNCDEKGICQNVEPLSTATIKISTSNGTKTIKWSASYVNEDDPELKRFQNVTKIIEDIISQKEKTMNIEQPECGYL